MVYRQAKPVDLLLVEDNPADVHLVEEALGGKLPDLNLHHVEDGEAALAFLRRQGEFAEKPRPDIVLLDLNLPRLDGHEVLAQMKGDDDLHRIPVVILTVSSDRDDIQRTYDLHANSFITKPSDPGSFSETLNKTMTFWLKASHLPGR